MWGGRTLVAAPVGPPEPAAPAPRIDPREAAQLVLVTIGVPSVSVGVGIAVGVGWGIAAFGLLALTLAVLLAVGGDR